MVGRSVLARAPGALASALTGCVGLVGPAREAEKGFLDLRNDTLLCRTNLSNSVAYDNVGF